MRQFTMLLLILISAHSLYAGNVIGYFTNWGIYGDKPYTPQDVFCGLFSFSFWNAQQHLTVKLILLLTQWYFKMKHFFCGGGFNLLHYNIFSLIFLAADIISSSTHYVTISSNEITYIKITIA